jgi:hypothetical protein
VLAQRDSAGTHVALLWLEGTRRVWIDVQEPESEDSLVAAVEPGRALDAFRHPYAYLSRADHSPELLAA